MFNFLKEYFSFTRSETRISLAVICLLLVSFIFRIIVAHKSYPGLPSDDEKLAEILEFINNLDPVVDEKMVPDHLYENVENKFKPFIIDPLIFDPNTADSSILVRMGIDKFIIRNILRYRRAGGRFRINTDLLKIYGMNDSIYNIICDYIVIKSDSTHNPHDLQEVIANFENNQEVISINSADSALLIRINGIGPVLAGRIIKFRNLLGGFFSHRQLMDVFGMDSSNYKKILPVIYIDTLQIKKIKLNTAEEKELSRHPYISFNLARDIIKYRELKGRINISDELVLSGIISETDLEKINFYFDYD